MNCTQAKELILSAHLGPAPELNEHLAACPACREEQARCRKLFEILDAQPVPTVAVNVAELFAAAERQRRRHARRWRSAALACGALAAACLLFMGLRLEVRTEPGAIVLRWGKRAQPSAPEPVAPSKVVQAPGPSPQPAVTAEDMQLAKDLIGALAGRLETLDERQRENAAALALRLDALTYRLRAWQAAQQQRTAYYPVSERGSEQGAKR